jgi:hypothetical protein
MKNILIFITLLSLYSCSKIFSPDDEFSIEKHDYIGDEIKLDGYYYKYDGQVYLRYCLYGSGIIRQLGVSEDFDDSNFYLEITKAIGGYLKEKATE